MIKERAFTTGMIILAVVVVIVLGVLQYRWSNQVSEATSIRPVNFQTRLRRPRIGSSPIVFMPEAPWQAGSLSQASRLSCAQLLVTYLIPPVAQGRAAQKWIGS
jgi:hypothetical protein